MAGVSAPSSSCFMASLSTINRALSFCSGSTMTSVSSNISFSKSLPLKFALLEASTRSAGRCYSNAGPGDNDSKNVLDAFFLGKALAEVVTERVESAVGDLLSTVGKLQAEQQKQMQEFQEDVLERAKRARDQAAKEALEPQGLPSKPVVSNSAEETGTSTSENITIE